MSLPIMNAHVVSTSVFDFVDANSTGIWELSTAKNYAMFAVRHAVDVSGMELAIVNIQGANTLLTQVIASAGSTMELVVVDGGTANSGAVAIQSGDDFSNTRAGGWLTHEAVVASPSGTTDLDQNDWLSLNVVANATGTTGVGVVQIQASFVSGIPGAIA